MALEIKLGTEKVAIPPPPLPLLQDSKESS